MYRDGLVERRERAVHRLADVIESGTRALALRYVAATRGALSSALTAAREPRELDALEHALDVAEGCVAACKAEHARVSEEAAAYATIGAPAPSAFLVTGLGFPDPAEWSPKVAEAMRERLRALPLTGDLIAAPRAAGIALFFMDGDRPFLVEVDAKPFDDDTEYYTTVSLVGRARATRSSIAIRPQTFGDDLFATLRIHRDHSFGDDAFDPLYFVAGEEDALEDFFTADVRAAFVMIARREPVIADIADGTVRLELKTQTILEACAFIGALE